MLNTSFKEKVYAIVSQIPLGQVLSYQEVAKLAGSPRAYRAVGNLMHNNPDPKNIPCHRVVASQNKLGGYAWGTLAKIKKLQAEGWQIKGNQLSK
ncbi:MGMT family protein [Candidatus Nomurabacteria bacterium]|nr:MGMT family protein [Candidatus Nomurabacteria bacterium]